MEIETNQMQPKLLILIIITSMAMETNHMMLHLLMSLTITWMKITQPPQIFNGDVVIEEVKEIKILGVFFNMTSNGIMNLNHFSAKYIMQFQCVGE